MMRRWIIGAFVAGVALAGGYAVAQIVTALPFQLQNNTVADATQVMANFNQIRNNVNSNSAKNGANSDITSLLGLTTPIAPSVGGTTTWTGGTSTGSANAQVVASVVPSTFSLVAGTHVVFKAGFINSALVTLNVAGTGAKNVFRQTNLGPLATAGGEILTDQMVEVIYDGTQYQLPGPMVYIGEVKDFTQSTAPFGYLLANGACVSQTTYAALFATIGTAWGSCSAGNFALPDYRGRTSFGVDGGANRITNAGSGCTATLTTGCGAQNRTINQNNLPNVNFTLSISDTRTLRTTNNIYSAGAVFGMPAGALLAVTAVQQPVEYTGSGSIGGTAASGGSGDPLVTLPPALIVSKVIKY